MFITKSRYQSEVNQLKYEYARLEKELELYVKSTDKYHQSLLNQIDDLKRLVFIPRSEPAQEIMEADNVISASEKPYQMSEAQQTEMLEGYREMDLIVSGNYDTDLMN